MLRASYVMMQEVLPVARNKMFTIVGFVAAIKVEAAFTRLSVAVDPLLKANSSGETIYVYFMGDIKKFVDEEVIVSNMVDISGHINVSRKSTPDNQILRLEGRHLYIYRNIEPPYKYANYVDYKALNNEDLAF